MVGAVICIAGGIASGKTTLARALAEHLPDSAVRSFGDVVRRNAVQQGLPVDRPTLQQTGLRLITEGWPAFVQQLVADVPADIEYLVIDGVRHQEAADELQHRFPAAAVHVVLLSVEPRAQQARLRERAESFASLDHSVEADLPRLLDTAITVDATQPVAEIVDLVITRIGPRTTHKQSLPLRGSD